MSIPTFFFVVFSIYSALHYYLYLKIKGAFYLTLPESLGVIVLFILMILAPVFVRIAERDNLETLARIIAYAGYLWMGTIFLFFTLSLLIDLYGGVVKILSPSGDIGSLIPAPKTAFYLAAALSCLIGMIGYYAALQIRTDFITLTTPKLPPQVERLRIALISDVHLGVIVGEARLKRILAAVESARPDVLLSLGDLVDGQLDNIEQAVSLLTAYQPPLGKYAVLGNHEYIVGLQDAMTLTKKAGFTLLRGEATTLGGLINLVGLDDPSGPRFGHLTKGNAGELLGQVNRDRFTLVMKHQPIVKPETLGLFDLQVSGHTHRGQIFPFYLLSRLVYNFPAGYTDLGQGSALYVNRGTGTWGPPIRFLAPPEVTIIDLAPPAR